MKTDSEGAFNVSKTAKFTCRSRHIEHEYHYLRQQVQLENLKVVTILGKENPIDILTKLLSMMSVNGWTERCLSTSEPGKKT